MIITSYKHPKLLIILVFICYSNIIKSQSKKTDSLIYKDYPKFDSLITKNWSNIDISIQLSHAYLEEAKTNKDSLNMMEAYFYLSSLYYQKNPLMALEYSDSTLQICINSKFVDYNYPFSIYRWRGDIYYDMRNFKKSLDNFLSAQKYLNDDLDFGENHADLNIRIGLLKSRLGNYDEALIHSKKAYLFFSSKGRNKISAEYYLACLFALSDGYLRTNQSDSTSIINKIGIQESSKYKLDNDKAYFILYEGINHFKKGNFLTSIDSLENTILRFKRLKDLPNLAEAYFYLAKSNLEIGKEALAIDYFKKVDSVFIQTQDLHPTLRSTYEELISFYNSKKDTLSQLIYLNRLLKFDSIINGNYQHLSTKIIKEYDTPIILEEKQKLIQKIEGTNNLKSRIIFWLIVILIVVSVLTFYFYRKRIHYKKRFEAILENKSLEKDADQKKEKRKLLISQNIVSNVQVKLESFEQEDQFLDRSISLNKLAIIFGTNSNYLSKIINHHKNKNFSSYLNQLRIQYAVQKLKEDTQFRKYDIKSIAQEVGFNSAESFSKAFYKQTGIYPSYFIKKLNKSS